MTYLDGRRVGKAIAGEARHHHGVAIGHEQLRQLGEFNDRAWPAVNQKHGWPVHGRGRGRCVLLEDHPQAVERRRKQIDVEVFFVRPRAATRESVADDHTSMRASHQDE